MTKWEYMRIKADVPTGSQVLQRHDDYKVKLVNGKELPNWTKGPDLTEHFNQLGLEGWELVGFHYDNFWFKRSI